MDNIATFFLSFSHDTIIIPFVVLGYIWLERSIFYHGICLILLSIILNYALKITFKIPLSPHLGKQGFAFPSGHMQSSVVLYGWLLSKTQNKIYKLFIIFLLSGIGFSLIYFNYHNYLDIIGAIFFAVLLITAYALLLSHNKKMLPWVIFFLGSLLMLYISIAFELPRHLWMAYYGVIGLMISEHLFSKKQNSKPLHRKLISTAICFAMILGIKALFTIQELSHMPAFLNQIQWGLIGFSIPLSCRVY